MASVKLKQCTVSICKFSIVSMEHFSSLEAQSPSTSEESPGLLLNLIVRPFYTALMRSKLTFCRRLTHYAASQVARFDFRNSQ